MKIGITGADGFLAWHLRVYLRLRGIHEVRMATRTTFAHPEKLADFVVGLDAVVHLAGMNRGDDAEIETTNVALADALTAACDYAESHPHIVFFNSTHAERDTAYGRGKRVAAAHLSVWANRAGAGFTNLILPHVFGEHGRPFYNSVVSTFCHQLALRELPQIIVDGDLELVHAQEVAAQCVALLESRHKGDLRLVGMPLKVSALLDKLMDMSSLYFAQIMPDLHEPFDLRLFNTFRSYLYPAYYPVTLKLHADERGSLFEVIKSESSGQVFLSTTFPGITRGNHFHARKVERFLVTTGEAEIRFRKLFSEEVVTFRVSGDAPCYIDIPTFHTHSITNVGAGELVTLFWANEIFNPEDADTYIEPVLAR